jgi:HAD superfamily hydrolase (TIGR01490 family)
VAAFFDVDNTIIRGASAFHIARGLHRRGYFGTRDILRFAWEQLKYLVFGESKDQINAIRTKGLSIIEGWSVAEMASIGEEIYDEVLALRIFPGTKALLDSHLAQGHEVWVITASPVEIGRLIARRLGATGGLGTVAAQQKGFYTGELVGDLMHGKKKAKAAKRLAKERGIDLARSYAYGDSMNDVHILQSVGHPCAINPEPRLRRFAKKHHWRIEDFRGKRGDGRRSIAQLTWAGALWAFLASLRGLKRAVFALFRRRK